MNSFSLAERLGNAVIAYVRYLGYAIWPAHLAFFYPHTEASLSVWRILAASLLLLVITLVALASRNRRYLAVGWLWFLGTLVPMIGLVQVGSQALADRYAYLSFVGLFLAVGWGVADCLEQWQLFQIWGPAGTIAILLLLMFATRRQLSYWSDDLTLWTHSAQIIKNNWMAENMIGETLVLKGDSEDAIAHFRAAAAMEPRFPLVHLHIGIYEEEHRHSYEAIQQFKQVIDLTQKDAAHTPHIRNAAFVHMSFAYNQVGDYANQEKYLNMAAGERQP
jgi:tetratricopeptide (TPR) repeat protein